MPTVHMPTTAIEERRTASGRVYYTGVRTTDVEGAGYVELRTQPFISQHRAAIALVALAAIVSDEERAKVAAAVALICPELDQ